MESLLPCAQLTGDKVFFGRLLMSKSTLESLGTTLAAEANVGHRKRGSTGMAKPGVKKKMLVEIGGVLK